MNVTRMFVLFILVVFSSIQSKSQHSNNETLILNSDGLTYDSVMSIISNNELPFLDKIETVRDIEDISNPNKVNEIYRKILLQAKEQKEKKYTVDLYCSLANNYLMLNDLEKSKNYLDSAQIYENKTDSLSSKALLSFIMGRYYQITKQEDEAIKYFHKCISFFEQIKGKESTAILLLYSLAEGYNAHKDIDGLKKIMEKMTSLLGKVDDPVSYIHTYAVAIVYYELLYKETLEECYKDSITLYNEKGISIFENADEITQNIIRSLIIENYLNVAEAKLNQDIPDWTKVKEYITIAEQMLAREDLSYIGLVDCKVILYRIRSKVLLHEKKYKEANKEALKALEIMDSDEIRRDFSLYSTIYSILISTYEEMGEYKMASKYYKLKEDITQEIDREKRFATIKELETKYETAQKELEISRLNEEQKQMQYNRGVLIACFIVIAVLLLVALLYNRLKRLKKEKEAIEIKQRIEEKELEYQTLLNETQYKMTEQYLSGLEGERIRLGKELHDGVANDLFSIILHIENNGKQGRTISLLKDAYANVRNISHHLVPPLMNNVTFSDVLIDFVEVKNMHSGIDLQLEFSSEDRWESLPPNFATEAYRIIQEAVSNTIKYSHASCCKIKVSYSNKIFTAEIVDNGIGFDLNKKSKGLGIRIMKERAKHMNADLDITSEIGKGTEIKLVSHLFIRA